ncbi:hypothetical protein KAU11_01310 [Candidatus Babeliales bacterium]|nr:hypothetical protein [Candidatus Babeliales bacterium]
MQPKKPIFFFGSCFTILFLLLATNNAILCKSLVYFSPDDKPTKHLITLIKNAEKRIYAAVYMLTDKRIALALIDAKEKRNIDVQVVSDQISKDSKFGKIPLLSQHGIKTFVFKPDAPATQFSQSIMHNKFAIIDNLLWTGSFNWTVGADRNNQENVLLTDDQDVCKKYLSHFKKLKKRCVAQKVNKSKAGNHSKQRSILLRLCPLGAIVNRLRALPHQS